MHKRLHVWILLMALPGLILTGIAQAHAQYSDSMGGSFNNPISSSLSSQIWGNLQMQQNLNMQRMLMQRRRQVAPQIRTEPTPSRSTATAPQATTTFRPVAPQLMPRQLAAMMGKTPSQRQQLEQLLAICLKLFDYLEKKQEPAHKVVPHDVACSLSYYLAANYEVYTQKEVTPRQYEALCVLTRSLLRQYPSFQSLSNRQRQQLHESFAILGSLPALAAYEEAAKHNNKQQLEAARQLALKNLQNLGLSPETMQITDTGLEIRQTE
ncbi:MAG TPA: DUF6683 family protein [Chthonomonadaceae bacterium]|nr:DUF6683 family protein [Chthonomonadaceae bacterium]